MSLRLSYSLIAPIYDIVVAHASRAPRIDSLAGLPTTPGDVLLAGVGTGLDLPLLPSVHRYVGCDITPAMLTRARPRVRGLRFDSVLGDVQRLPFADASFDAVVLHLILAVVPDPRACLAEAARVLRPGGTILLLDKFLRAGQRAPLRRMANPLVRRLATRLDVVFEDVLREVKGLTVVDDQAALAGGWFRRIRLQRDYLRLPA